MRLHVGLVTRLCTGIGLQMSIAHTALTFKFYCSTESQTVQLRTLSRYESKTLMLSIKVSMLVQQMNTLETSHAPIYADGDTADCHWDLSQSFEFW